MSDSQQRGTVDIRMTCTGCGGLVSACERVPDDDRIIDILCLIFADATKPGSDYDRALRREKCRNASIMVAILHKKAGRDEPDPGWRRIADSAEEIMTPDDREALAALRAAREATDRVRKASLN